MNESDRRKGESLPDYIKRLEDFVNSDPPRPRTAINDWLYRMRLLKAKALWLAAKFIGGGGRK